MTCIVGLIDKGTVYMGADSAGMYEDLTLITYTEPKIFRLANGMLLGTAGDARPLQVIEHMADIPVQRDGDDDLSYLVNGFVEAIRVALVDAGAATEKWGYQTSPISFLLGYRGALYDVAEDFSVAQFPGYMAAGHGRLIALGSLFTTGRHAKKLTPRKRIITALEAAAQYDASVRGPFQVESV